MENWGLLLLGLIQTGTGISTFFSVNQTSILGIQSLPRELSIYRYMLTALWLSVSILYFTGAINPAFTKGASLLAVVNVVFEIIGYWMAKLPRWYQITGTLVMGLFGLLSSLVFF